MSYNFCNSCDSCDYCNFCNSCDYCDYCYHCDYCKNLKMTEHNYFCWAKEYNDENSFQQKRYRVFNVEVSKEEYEKINKIYHKLEFDKNEIYDTRFQTAFKKMRDKLSKEERQEYLDIPHFNWEWFTYITWIKPEDVEEQVEEMTVEQICKELGRNIKIIK